MGMFLRACWIAACWTLPTAMFALALLFRNPLCFKVRYLLLYLICQSAVFLAPRALRCIGEVSGPGRRLAHTFRAALILAAASLAVGQEVDYQLLRYRVLHSSADTLRQVGAYLVVGYRDFDEVRELVRLDAVAGVFITARNVRQRTLRQIQKDLQELQRIRRGHGLPPLIITADQEGGIVSRLSPPLPALPALSTLAGFGVGGNEGSMQQRVEAYAAFKARGLAALGVTANLGPVLDLRPTLKTRKGVDLYSSIHERAISSDPEQVARVAEIYSRALWRHGVRPTLKHFPGLGRVAQDTHLYSARLDTSISELERSDWLPFRRVSRAVPAMIMLGHVNLTRLDPAYPASSSRRVVNDLLRRRWGFGGMLITDDFCMIPAWRGLGGIGPSVVRSLRAGVDLVLVSADEQEVYPVLAELLRARQEGRLPPVEGAYARLLGQHLEQEVVTNGGEVRASLSGALTGAGRDDDAIFPGKSLTDPPGKEKHADQPRSRNLPQGLGPPHPGRQETADPGVRADQP